MLTIIYTLPDGSIEGYEYEFANQSPTMSEILCVPNGVFQRWEDVELNRKLNFGYKNEVYDTLPRYNNSEDTA